MEGNGGSLEDCAETFVLFLRGAQLVLMSSVLTVVLDHNEVDVTMKNAEILGSAHITLEKYGRMSSQSITKHNCASTKQALHSYNYGKKATDALKHAC